MGERPEEWNKSISVGPVLDRWLQATAYHEAGYAVAHFVVRTVRSGPVAGRRRAGALAAAVRARATPW